MQTIRFQGIEDTLTQTGTQDSFSGFVTLFLSFCHGNNVGLTFVLLPSLVSIEQKTLSPELEPRTLFWVMAFVPAIFQPKQIAWSWHLFSLFEVKTLLPSTGFSCSSRKMLICPKYRTCLNSC